MTEDRYHPGMLARAWLTRGLLLVALVAAASACKRRKTATGASSSALTQSYTSANGLVTAHYPADFAAKRDGESVIILSRNLRDGTDEAVAFVAVDTPISDDLEEFTRVVNLASTKQLNRYEETGKRPASCGKFPGIEITGSWRAEDGITRYERRACHFLHGGHGYVFTFSVPKRHASEEIPQLMRILEATELGP